MEYFLVKNDEFLNIVSDCSKDHTKSQNNSVLLRQGVDISHDYDNIGTQYVRINR